MDTEYIVHIWKMQKLYEFIRNFEELVEESERKLSLFLAIELELYWTVYFRMQKTSFKENLPEIQ